MEPKLVYRVPRGLLDLYQTTMLGDMKDNVTIHYDKLTNCIYVKYLGYENTIFEGGEYFILIEFRSRYHSFVPPRIYILTLRGNIEITTEINCDDYNAYVPITTIICSVIFALSDEINELKTKEEIDHYDIAVKKKVNDIIKIDQLNSLFDELRFIKTLSKEFINEYINKKMESFSL